MILPKEEFQRITKLVASKNYMQLFSYFVMVLRRTRLPILKNNGIFMGVIQIKMFKTLLQFQSEFRSARSELSQPNLDEKNRKLLEEKLSAYKEWIRIMQTIADGIAWRALKFNRPLIRLFSENNSPGHASQKDFQVYTNYVKKLPYYSIINDLTRCLRISDITHILPDGKVFLYEIKESGDKLKDLEYILHQMSLHKRFLSSQELRQWVVQFAIMDNKIKVPIFKDGIATEELKADIINLGFPIKTHFKAIKKLVQKANKGIITQGELEPGYFVEAQAYDRFVERNIEIKEYEKKIESARQQRPVWLKSKKNRTISISNYDSFLQEKGQYPRNLIPYSVIPFSAKDCVRLMMGGLHLRIYCNMWMLKEKLERSGWIVQENTKRTVSVNKEVGDFSKYQDDDVFYRLSRPEFGRTYTTTIPLTQILIMISSMYSFDFIVDEANNLYQKARLHNSEGRYITINFLGEKEILV